MNDDKPDLIRLTKYQKRIPSEHDKQRLAEEARKREDMATSTGEKGVFPDDSFRHYPEPFLDELAEEIGVGVKPLTEAQQKILYYLAPENRPEYKMTLDELCWVLSKRENILSRPTVVGHLKALQSAGRVANKSGVGYYLPGNPPQKLF